MNKLTIEDVGDIIGALGETGCVKIRNGGVYSRREENATWLYRGQPEDLGDTIETLLDARMDASKGFDED